MLDEKKLTKEIVKHTTYEALNGEPTGLAWIHLSNKEWLRVLSSCRVPIQSPERTDVRSSERIEAAIRYLRKEYRRDGSDVWNDWELANAIAWASGLPQEENKKSVYPGLWEDKDFSL